MTSGIRGWAWIIHFFKTQEIGWECSSVTGCLPIMHRPWVQSQAYRREKKQLKKWMNATSSMNSVWGVTGVQTSGKATTQRAFGSNLRVVFLKWWVKKKPHMTLGLIWGTKNKNASGPGSATEWKNKSSASQFFHWACELPWPQCGIRDPG
jgi:hypothetical protein